MALNKIELLRSTKHIKLKSVGISGQESLKSAKVLVIGAGDLGCIVLQSLTSAGIGTIGIIDGDIVEESNLQSQILYSQSDINLPKAKTAALRLKTQNLRVNFKVANITLTKENILSLLEPFNIIVNCTDKSSTNYLINDACILTNKPLIFGTIKEFEGQITVFNFEGGPTYRCLFPEQAIKTGSNTISNTGLFSVLPALIGSLQANEVLKMILGIGDLLSGKILSLNTLNYEKSIVEYDKSEFANISNLNTPQNGYTIAEEALKTSIDVVAFDKIRKSKPHYNILDVREYFEWDICHIQGSSNIPMNLIDQCIEEISKTIPTVVVCHHGVRSMNVIDYLKTKGYNNWSTQFF